MATASIVERLDMLEAEVAEVKRKLSTERVGERIPWWEQRFGAFVDLHDRDPVTCGITWNRRPKSQASPGLVDRVRVQRLAYSQNA